MSLATAELPDDPDALRAFARACQGALKAAETAVQLKALEIEKLRFQIAKLRRMQFGGSSERISRQIEQLELRLEELETGAAADEAGMEADAPAPVPGQLAVVGAGEVPTPVNHLAAGGHVEPADDVEQGRLAAA